MRLKTSFITLLLGAVLASCSPGRQEVPTPMPSATAALPPTAVPTPESPLAILVVPADMDPATSDTYQRAVYELAQGSGMRFQVRNSMGPSDLEPGLHIVVALPPDPGIASLASLAPQVQFLAINMPEVAASDNVSILAGNSESDLTAFLAGYTAALISDDFRAGMILPQDDPVAQRAKLAFANGMAFHCGLCSSYRLHLDSTGAGIRFPQHAEIPADEDPSRFGGWANYLVGSQKVDALYVYPDPRLAVPQLYAALGQTGAQIIGTTTPEPRPAGWVMGIRADALKAIYAAWPELVAGRGGQSIPSPLGLADVDPLFLTPGRQRLVEQVLDDLQAGRISPGVGQ